jgi:hypothetical protein
LDAKWTDLEQAEWRFYWDFDKSTVYKEESSGQVDFVHSVPLRYQDRTGVKGRNWGIGGK